MIVDYPLFPTVEWCKNRGHLDFNEWLTIAGSVPAELADKLSYYDEVVARCSIDNYGVVFIDCYDQPIDDFDYIETLLDDSQMVELIDDIRSGLVISARVKF